MTTTPSTLLLSPRRLSWSAGFAGVLWLSAPIIPGMLSQMLMGFFDTWMVSQIGVTERVVWGMSVPLDTLAEAGAGKSALAAVTPASMMCWAVMSVFIGTVVAVSTFASQAIGRGTPREAGRYTWQAIHFGAMTLLVVVAAVATAPWMFGRFAPTPTVLAHEVVYFKIRIWCLPVVVIGGGLSSFFRGIHRPVLPALTGIVANVLNVALNWCLVYGRGGLPRLGIAGAATASLLMTCLDVVVLAAIFLGPSFAKRYGTRAGWRPSLRRLGRLVWIGMPGGLSWLLDMIGWSLLIIVLVQQLGEAEAAASNAAMNYLHIGFMPVAGVGIALTALVGKAIGQRRIDHARRFATCAFLIGGGYQLLIGVVLIVFRHDLIGFFNTDPQVVRFGSYALIAAGVFQFFDAMGIIYGHALRGAGDTHFLLGTHFLLILGLFIPLSWWGTRYLAARHWPDLQSTAPWVAGTIYIILLGMVFLFRWLSRRWEHIDIFGEGEQGSPIAS